jgi:hypothetical protein
MRGCAVHDGEPVLLLQRRQRIAPTRNLPARAWVLHCPEL